MKNGKRRRSYLSLQIITDLMLMYGSYMLGISLFNLLHRHHYGMGVVLPLMPVLLLVGLVLFDVFHLYDVKRLDGPGTFLAVMLSTMLANAVLVVIAYGFNLTDLPAKLFIYAWLIQIVLFSVGRWIRNRLYRRINPLQKILLLTNESESVVLRETWKSKLKKDYQLYQEASSLEEITDQDWTEADVLLLGQGLSESEKEKAWQQSLLYQLPVMFVPSLPHILLHRAKLMQIDDVLLFRMEPKNLIMEERIAKRLMDLVVSLLLMLVFSPLLLLVALAIKLEDKGPVLYSQERLTKNVKPFWIYKFRTMRVDAEKESGPVLASRDDGRITKVGRFLRSTRIDEFPQLINVLKGDMSLVGPRPERPFFVETYQRTIPHYGERFRVRPGLTGLAQVEGRYQTKPEDKLTYDLLYLFNYSLLLDLRILLQTMQVVLSPYQARGLEENAGFEERPNG